MANVTTFEHNGVTYTVRALTVNEARQVINIAADILYAYSLEAGLNVPHEERGKLGSYPYSLQSAAVNYAELITSTTYDTEPAHTFPRHLFDIISLATFKAWLDDCAFDRVPLREWRAAFQTSNMVDPEPKKTTSDVIPESA